MRRSDWKVVLIGGAILLLSACSSVTAPKGAKPKGDSTGVGVTQTCSGYSIQCG